MSDGSSDVCSSDLAQFRSPYGRPRVETGGVIAAGGKLRIGIAESRQPSLAVVSHQIGKAPAIHRLHGTRLMPQGLELAQQPALEMSVAVVPAGQIGRASCRERVSPYG